LAEETLTKLRGLLKKQLIAFCEEKGHVSIRQLQDIDTIAEFRQSWTDAPISALKKLERLRTFFRFCQKRGWIDENPASEIKPPKVPDKPTLPFSKEEMEKLIWACELFSTNGRYRAKNRTRIKALVLLMRYSGLAIRDAVTLERRRINEGKLFLYRHKTGVPVTVLLPEPVLLALNELDDFPDRFFWNGRGKVESAVGVWERTFARLFEIAGIKDGHSHRFRDTFAVELLNKNVPLEDVATLLGHRSTKTTEKQYAPWVSSRQQKLEEMVQRSWN
jgi:integrase